MRAGRTALPRRHRALRRTRWRQRVEQTHRARASAGRPSARTRVIERRQVAVRLVEQLAKRRHAVGVEADRRQRRVVRLLREPAVVAGQSRARPPSRVSYAAFIAAMISPFARRLSSSLGLARVDVGQLVARRAHEIAEDAAHPVGARGQLRRAANRAGRQASARVPPPRPATANDSLNDRVALHVEQLMRKLVEDEPRDLRFRPARRTTRARGRRTSRASNTPARRRCRRRRRRPSGAPTRRVRSRLAKIAAIIHAARRSENTTAAASAKAPASQTRSR